jgi:sarcosine oxidase
MKRVDIAIIGLGVYGSAAAGAFAAHGWKTLAVETAAADEVRGASRGPVRMVRTNVPGQKKLAGLAAASAGQWQALSGTLHRPLFQRVPGILAGPTPGGGEPITADDPILADVAIPGSWTVTRDNECGLLQACPAVLALRERAAAGGAELRFGRTADLGNEPPADSPAVLRVGRDRVAADRVLCCVGAWSPRLPRWARVPGLRIEPADMQIATFHRAPAAIRQDAFYIFGGTRDRFCAMPLASGDGVQFGHFASRIAGHAGPTWRRDMAALRRYFPELGETRARTTIRSYYTIPPGGAFVLRKVSPHTATLAACSGIGFKFAPAIADQVVTVFEGGEPALAGLRVEDWRGVGACP